MGLNNTILASSTFAFESLADVIGLPWHSAYNPGKFLRRIQTLDHHYDRTSQLLWVSALHMPVSDEDLAGSLFLRMKNLVFAEYSRVEYIGGIVRDCQQVFRTRFPDIDLEVASRSCERFRSWPLKRRWCLRTRILFWTTPSRPSTKSSRLGASVFPCKRI